jgi:hypothetical protein
MFEKLWRPYKLNAPLYAAHPYLVLSPWRAFSSSCCRVTYKARAFRRLLTASCIRFSSRVHISLICLRVFSCSTRRAVIGSTNLWPNSSAQVANEEFPFSMSWSMAVQYIDWNGRNDCTENINYIYNKKFYNQNGIIINLINIFI